MLENISEKWFIRGGSMEVICVLIAIIIVLVAIIIGYKREFRRINEEITNNLDEYVNIKTKSVDKDVEIFSSKYKFNI